jgi:hypothetical protein
VGRENNVTAKAWRSLHFIARILKKGSSKTKELAYLSLIRPLTEYGADCWDPYRQNQMDTLEHVQRRARNLSGSELVTVMIGVGTVRK